MAPTGTTLPQTPRTAELECELDIKIARDDASDQPPRQQDDWDLPTRFQAELAERMNELRDFDRLTITLKFLNHSAWLSNESQTGGVSCKRLERILSRIYVQAEREKARIGQALVHVNVLIDRFSQLHRSQSAFFPSNTSPQYPHTFRVLALGGTFDHLHSGHKILLTVAAWLAHHKLIVGITDDELLRNKKYSDQLESLKERKEGVVGFLETVGPKDMRVETPTLRDIYGPTATEAEIDGLLVSRETVSGADSIDQIRRQNGLQPLARYVIDLISSSPHTPSSDRSIELKISSTEIRRYLHNLHHPA